MNDWKLKFWDSGEYQVICEKLDDIKKSGLLVCPLKKGMFRVPFRECSYENVKVVILGQDPYPNPEHCTGLAFSLPVGFERNPPPTWSNLISEYMADLHLPKPTPCPLTPWANRGVLLWNVIPSCTAYKSMSHSTWTEWDYLNYEIINKLNEKKDLVVVCLGSKAREYTKYFNPWFTVLTYSHPSPRSILSSKTPFLGSRMFSNVNAALKEPINWRL